MVKKTLIAAVMVMLIANLVVYGDNTISESGGSASSAIVLNAEPVRVSCVVPTHFFISDDAAVIKNTADSPILLKSIVVTVGDLTKEITMDIEISAYEENNISTQLIEILEKDSINECELICIFNI